MTDDGVHADALGAGGPQARTQSQEGGERPDRPPAGGWDAVSAQEVLEGLGSTAQGLSQAEAARRLEQVGPNSVEEGHRESLPEALLESLREPLQLLLIVVGVLSAIWGELRDAIAIFAIIAAVAGVETASEWRARKALDALRSLTAPRARALRDGQLLEIPARELVPGDVVALEAGDVVPADCRIIDASGLVPLVGVLRGQPLRPMVLAGLTLAFATIPEELPILVTVLLAVGGRRLAQRGALLRRLRAGETLGALTVVVTDKTGTLTENRLRLAHLNGAPREVLEVAVGCQSLRSRGGELVGDPLEVALAQAASQQGVGVEGAPVATFPLRSRPQAHEPALAGTRRPGGACQGRARGDPGGLSPGRRRAGADPSGGRSAGGQGVAGHRVRQGATGRRPQDRGAGGAGAWVRRPGRVRRPAAGGGARGRQDPARRRGRHDRGDRRPSPHRRRRRRPGGPGRHPGAAGRLPARLAR